MRSLFMDEMLDILSSVELCCLSMRFDIHQKDQHTMLQKINFIAETVLYLNELVENHNFDSE